MGATYSKGDQTGKNIIVTGANSGIGYFTALELGRLGANVILLARDEGRGSKALADMKASNASGKYSLELCDLSDLESVRSFAKRFNARGIPLDTLVNNAGIMMPPTRVLSKDGFESQWATNHLGHFALTGLLMEPLLASKAPRVVNVSSMMAWIGSLSPTTPIDFVLDSGYKPMRVYGDTKLANQLFTLELARRYPKLTAVAAHPGGSSTNLQKHAFKGVDFMLQSAESGALPSIRAATEANLPSGSYFGPRLANFGAAAHAFLVPAAKNAQTATKLWEASIAATKVTY